MTRKEKLMAFANNPSATPAEREAYQRKADELGADADKEVGEHEAFFVRDIEVAKRPYRAEAIPAIVVSCTSNYYNSATEHKYSICFVVGAGSDCGAIQAVRS